MKDIKVNVRERASKRSKTGVVYEYYFTLNGTRYSKTGFATEAKARKAGKEKYIDVIVNRDELEELNKISNMKFSDLWEFFLEHGQEKYKFNTFESTKLLGSQFKLADFWNMKIKNITKKDVQKFLDGYKCLTKKSISHKYFCLKRVFALGIENDLLKSNPCDNCVIKGREIAPKIKTVSEEDYNLMLEYLCSKNTFHTYNYAMALEIGKYLGLRVCETFALDKKDFDLDNKTVRIEKELVYKTCTNKELHVEYSTKTKASNSIIPIPDVFVDELRRWFEYNPYEHVIAHKDGGYLHPANLKSMMLSASKKLGIYFHYHMLRHNYATRLVMNNVNVKVAQTLLRHEDISTTLNIYTHISMEDQSSAVNKVF